MSKKEKVYSYYEETPNYVRQKKEVSMDPDILQSLLGTRPAVEGRNRVNHKIQLKQVWEIAAEKLSPLRLQILYLRFHVGEAEPQIAKALNISQPWVRSNIKTAINIIRKEFGLPPLKKIIENPNMVRDKTSFKKKTKKTKKKDI
jgi:DNA-directed RNA polymerase specialized sigma subunit